MKIDDIKNNQVLYGFEHDKLVEYTINSISKENDIITFAGEEYWIESNYFINRFMEKMFLNKEDAKRDYNISFITKNIHKLSSGKLETIFRLIK